MTGSSRWRRRAVVAAAGAAVAVALCAPAFAAQEPVRLFAAGSLRSAMTAIAAAFAKDGGANVMATFGPSGVLRERIEKGAPADVFASADTGQPTALMRAGRVGPVVVFARNRLCALARPGLRVTPRTLLDTFLNPAIKLGTSTPKSDPLGDYTWALFDKADKVRPGSGAMLKAKALQLVGGPNSPAVPPNRNLFAALFDGHRADIFVAYCSSTKETAKAMPQVTVVEMPPALSLGADYGLAVVTGSRPEAARFALFILSPPAQRILAGLGFTPVAVPRPAN